MTPEQAIKQAKTKGLDARSVTVTPSLLERVFTLLDQAPILPNARFDHATFTADARFNRVTFFGDAWFSEATFSHLVAMSRGARPSVSKRPPATFTAPWMRQDVNTAVSRSRLLATHHA